MFILFHISVVVWAYLFLVFLILSSLLANRLAGKSVVSKMAYFVPSGTLDLSSVNQSINATMTTTTTTF